VPDTHAHLGAREFDADRAEVIARARAAGVQPIVVVGEDLADARRGLELAGLHPELRPAAGLHPGRLDLRQAEELLDLIRRERRRLAAVGEVGLDHWVVQDEAARELQREIFTRFIELARELDLPLNVHSRSAGRPAIALLLARGVRRVQLHAFDGKASTALPAVEAGFFFSIPPSIVRSRQKQKLVRRLPLACLLAETDSPVLGPQPQERNEPANAARVVEAIAEIKGVHPAEARKALAENARRLYGPALAGPGE
jgi:TatD DNase family protein